MKSIVEGVWVHCIQYTVTRPDGKFRPQNRMTQDQSIHMTEKVSDMHDDFVRQVPSITSEFSYYFGILSENFDNFSTIVESFSDIMLLKLEIFDNFPSHK
jgi:hypothetical protein